ncbi:hypothetical protein, partial [Actinomyces succiniciruminis]|uniref:hypothetical protein n=1 Tax=Actinomyces succiniciruminis TaxID=1522002 RepID=UPI001B333925
GAGGTLFSSFFFFWLVGLGVACCRVPGLRALVAYWLLLLALFGLGVGLVGWVGCELYSGREHQ